ncbi:MAG: Gfo/Idh/MocA family protein, partial [Acidimicrobiales bacterium]
AALAARCSGRPFGTVGEMVDTAGLDGVWVCTPPSTHADLACGLMERGLPVYLEKPIARTLPEGRRIAAAAEATGAVCAVGYQWHALELVPAVRDVLGERTVGFVLGKNIGATRSRPWFVDRAAGGGNVLERASHHIDLIRGIAGEVESVQVGTSGVSLGGRPLGSGDVEDALTVVLHVASGAMATVLVVWLREGLPTAYGLEIAADGAYLDLDLDPAFTLGGVVDGAAVHREEARPALRSSIDRFLTAARARDPELVPCSPADALRTLAVARAAETALASGRTVPVGEDDGGPGSR